jgi:hypothetical protein
LQDFLIVSKFKQRARMTAALLTERTLAQAQGLPNARGLTGAAFVG